MGSIEFLVSILNWRVTGFEPVFSNSQFDTLTIKLYPPPKKRRASFPLLQIQKGPAQFRHVRTRYRIRTDNLEQIQSLSRLPIPPSKQASKQASRYAHYRTRTDNPWNGTDFKSVVFTIFTKWANVKRKQSSFERECGAGRGSESLAALPGLLGPSSATFFSRRPPWLR